MNLMMLFWYLLATGLVYEVKEMFSKISSLNKKVFFIDYPSDYKSLFSLLYSADVDYYMLEINGKHIKWALLINLLNIVMLD